MSGIELFKKQLVKLKRKLIPWWPTIRKVVVILAGIGLTVVVIKNAQGWWQGIRRRGEQSLEVIQAVYRPKEILQSSNDRVQILLMGMGGASHETPDLTDSMLVLSINLEKEEVTTISIPRDVWVVSMQAKINTAYHYGENRKPNGGGLVLAKDAAGQVTGLPIHYSLIIDFDGFIKAIDQVGGVEVEIETGFVDKKYPIPGKEQEKIESDRYETIEFKAGKEIMDGERVLKFARSRNAEGDEGTDFARSRRQQLVMKAFLEKVVSWKGIDLGQVKELMNIYQDSIKTEMSETELLALGKLALKTREKEVKVISLEEKLYHPSIAKYGQWVLRPVEEDWQLVHDFINDSLR